MNTRPRSLFLLLPLALALAASGCETTLSPESDILGVLAPECGVHGTACCETGGPKPYACLAGLRCFGTLPNWSCLFPDEGECGIHGAPCCETGGPKPYACLADLRCFGTLPNWSCLFPEEGPP